MRIIAVADSFDAMTTDRPYRPALSFDDAIVELKACNGTQFNLLVTATLIEWLMTGESTGPAS